MQQKIEEKIGHHYIVTTTKETQTMESSQISGSITGINSIPEPKQSSQNNINLEQYLSDNMNKGN